LNAIATVFQPECDRFGENTGAGPLQAIETRRPALMVLDSIARQAETLRKINLMRRLGANVREPAASRRP